MELAAGLASLKAAFDMAKALNGAHTQAQIDSVRVELLGKISDALDALQTARDERAALKDEIAALRQQIAGFERWDTERAKYELVEPVAGKLALKRKEGVQPDEPTHYICPHCAEARKKSLLQLERTGDRLYHLTCHPCGARITLGGFAPK